MEAVCLAVAARDGGQQLPSTRTRILAYLGELKPKEFVPVRKLIYDLSLRFTTAKNVLTTLEEEWIVDKKITVVHGTIAHFRISPDAVMAAPVAANSCEQRLVPFVTPEWSATYGKHPYGL